MIVRKFKTLPIITNIEIVTLSKRLQPIKRSITRSTRTLLNFKIQRFKNSSTRKSLTKIMKTQTMNRTKMKVAMYKIAT
jgi:hypothetical protein